MTQTYPERPSEIELLIDSHLRKARRRRVFREAVRSTEVRLGFLLILVVIMIALAGCVTPQQANEWRAVTPYTEIQMNYGLFAKARYRNYMNVDAELKCEYNPETRQFLLDTKLVTDAATPMKAQEGVMAEWTRQQQQQIEGLKYVVEQIKAHGENLDKLAARAVKLGEAAIGGFTAVSKIVADAANVVIGPDGVRAGSQLAPAAPGLDEEALRRIIREEIERTQPADGP